MPFSKMPSPIGLEANVGVMTTRSVMHTVPAGSAVTSDISCVDSKLLIWLPVNEEVLTYDALPHALLYELRHSAVVQTDELLTTLISALPELSSSVAVAELAPQEHLHRFAAAGSVMVTPS